jgi:hypothetical protein
MPQSPWIHREIQGGGGGGGSKWETLTVPGLKAFLAIHMYMGMKK